MEYKVKDRAVDITESTTLMPEKKYGGWMAVNQGTAAAKVMGFELDPGEGINMLDSIPLGSQYDEPIKIEIQPGAVIRMIRRQALPIKEGKK